MEPLHGAGARGRLARGWCACARKKAQGGPLHGAGARGTLAWGAALAPGKRRKDKRPARQGIGMEESWWRVSPLPYGARVAFRRGFHGLRCASPVAIFMPSLRDRPRWGRPLHGAIAWSRGSREARTGVVRLRQEKGARGAIAWSRRSREARMGSFLEGGKSPRLKPDSSNAGIQRPERPLLPPSRHCMEPLHGAGARGTLARGWCAYARKKAQGGAIAWSRGSREVHMGMMLPTHSAKKRGKDGAHGMGVLLRTGVFRQG